MRRCPTAPPTQESTTPQSRPRSAARERGCPPYAKNGKPAGKSFARPRKPPPPPVEDPASAEEKSGAAAAIPIQAIAKALMDSLRAATGGGGGGRTKKVRTLLPAEKRKARLEREKEARIKLEKQGNAGFQRKAFSSDVGGPQPAQVHTHRWLTSPQSRSLVAPSSHTPTQSSPPWPCLCRPDRCSSST